MNLPIYGFMHVVDIRDGLDIAREQLKKLNATGLYKETSRIFMSVLGNNPDEIAQGMSEAYPGIDIFHRSDNVEEFEFPALFKVQEICKEQECLVWYIHAKGVRHFGRIKTRVNAWRAYMEYFLMERYQDCLSALETHDVCGVEWRPRPSWHFSGNFWWATGKYIRSLPELSVDERHNAEFWIGSNPDVRAKCMHKTSINLYRRIYPRSRYAKQEEVFDA